MPKMPKKTGKLPQQKAVFAFSKRNVIIQEDSMQLALL